MEVSCQAIEERNVLLLGSSQCYAGYPKGKTVCYGKGRKRHLGDWLVDLRRYDGFDYNGARSH